MGRTSILGDPPVMDAVLMLLRMSDDHDLVHDPRRDPVF
jgi:hypothetical protein